MEKKVSRLFDFQHFAQNSKMNSIIQDVESRYANALTDDDLALVSAAGEDQPGPKEDEDPGALGAHLIMIPEAEKP